MVHHGDLNARLASWRFAVSVASPSFSRLLGVHPMRTHLRSNLFPPVSAWYVPAAKRALKLYGEGKLDKRIWLPTGRRISDAL